MLFFFPPTVTMMFNQVFTGLYHTMVVVLLLGTNTVEVQMLPVCK